MTTVGYNNTGHFKGLSSVSVTSFRNQCNILIGCSQNIFYYYYPCWKQ